MFDDEIVVLHALNVVHNAPVNVVWFFVVLQVLVVHEYGRYMW